MLTSISFSLPQYFINEFESLLNSQKNADIGKVTVEIVKLYFKSIYPNCSFKVGKNNEPDMIVIENNTEIPYEIKGTKGNNIAFNKVKISSKYCYDKLIEGMEIIRVTNIGESIVKIYFLKNGIDFKMEPEDRWKVKKI